MTYVWTPKTSSLQFAHSHYRETVVTEARICLSWHSTKVSGERLTFLVLIHVYWTFTEHLLGVRPCARCLTSVWFLLINLVCLPHSQVLDCKYLLFRYTGAPYFAAISALKAVCLLISSLLGRVGLFKYDQSKCFPIKI